jgi:glucose/arabinose dehydrogenase
MPKYPSGPLSSPPVQSGVRRARNSSHTWLYWPHDEASPRSLLVGGLITKSVVRLTLENNPVTGEEPLFADRGQRVRDVRQGPDGAIHVLTDEENGELWKLSPRR